ncbi:MAG: hypothetical protein NT151_12845 [Acidobacteria bacterium]|nr:hypothetical protein [Acidobacteriota bacterium]
MANSRRWIIARRAAVVLWFVFGFVLWNDVFDATVAQGARDYLTRQILHEQGKGPGATIHGVMDEAVVRGAWMATAIGGGVCAVGLSLVWVAASRRRAGSLPRGTE